MMTYRRCERCWITRMFGRRVQPTLITRVDCPTCPGEGALFCGTGTETRKEAAE